MRILGPITLAPVTLAPVALALALTLGGCGAAPPGPVTPAAPRAPGVGEVVGRLPEAPPRPPLAERVADRLAALRAAEPASARLLPQVWGAGPLRFVDAAGPTADAEALRGLCAGLADEALPPDAVPCAGFEAALQAVAARRRALAGTPRPLDATDRAILGAALGPRALEGALDARGLLRPSVVAAAVGARATTPGAVARWVAVRDGYDAALADLELWGFRVGLAYGWALRGRYATAHHQAESARHAYVDRVMARGARRAGRTPRARSQPVDRPARADEAPVWAMQQVLRWLRTRPTAEVIAALRPRGDQYARLIAAHARYRARVAAAGFGAVPEGLGALRRGARHPAAPALRARLAQEGFDAPPSPEPDRVDAGLLDALARFQRAHQLRPAPAVGRGTRRALRIDAAEKQAKVAAALEARRAALRRPARYVEINIPDYHVELWRGGQRLERIPVVVGSSKRVWEPGGFERPNATPTLHAEITHVVYNPHWNIPARILDEEILDDEARALPNDEQIAWLEEKGYEVQRPGTRWQYVRQVAGPANPLGKVKILFPNPHDVYLHDTPARGHFARPVRAYSHGCVRVESPLRLAQAILTEDGQYDDQQVRRWLRDDDPRTVVLREPIPIFVEYVPVRVDDDGHAWFLRDVYERGFDVVIDAPGLDARGGT